MKRFFVHGLEEGASVVPAPDEAHHMRSVLRIRDGEHVVLFDGSGREFEAVVESTEDEPTVCRILSGTAAASELPVSVTVFQAVIKGDHFDYAVQKAVETGADEIIPFVADRSVKRPGNPEKFIVREQKIAREAARQCQRSRIPKVSDFISITDMADGTRKSPLIVAYEAERALTFRDVLEEGTPDAMRIVIGPEGGFSPDEVRLLEEKNARFVTLGPRILRAESAAPYMLAQIAYAFER